MKYDSQVFSAWRLVAQFADGQRLYFDGFTEEQARQRMESAIPQHGDIIWFDGVTDLHYEQGRFWKSLPQPPTITIIDIEE